MLRLFTRSTRKSHAVFFYLLLWTNLHSIAQATAEKHVSFDALTINDGLSQGMITSIVQDHYGFMWLGTKDGLNRFDGYDFMVYRHDPSDSTSLSDNFIRCIYEDSKGRLWIGTADHGVDVFIRETEEFVHLTHDGLNQNSLSDNRILSIQEDRTGSVWIGTLNGLNKLAIHEELSSTSDKSKVNSYQVKRFFSDECRFAISSNGMLWGSSLHHQLFTIVPHDNNDWIDTLETNRYCWYPSVDYGLEKHASLILEDSTHHQLYLVFEYCITRVDLNTGDVDIISKRRFHWGVFGNYACLDSSGNIWLSESNWLEQFNVHTGEIRRILAVDEHMNTMLDNIGGTYMDRSGIIWIGTKGYGVLKFNPQSEKFNKTGNESIQWMSTTPDQKIILCKYGNFLCVYNPFTGTYPVNIPDIAFKARTDYNDIGITSAALQDDKGVYWFAKNSLTSYDVNAQKLQRLRISDRFVFPVYQDKNYDVWFGTKNTFSHYNKVSGIFTDYPYPIIASSEPYDFLEVIHQDASGIFWLGTISGLFRFDPLHQAWTQFKNIPGDPASISNDVIFSLCADPAEPETYLWIGINGGGLNRFDKQTGKVIRYTQKNGLPNDVIYGILSDDEGQLWMSTNKGISCFNLQMKTFRNYEYKDGLQGNEFNRYAYCSIKNHSGNTKKELLFFGGVNGFNFFDPKELQDNRFLPDVQITDFKIRNQSVSHRDKNAHLQKPMYLTKKIILPYSDNLITFVFASLDFAAPEKNVYQYKLDGFDDAWVNAGNNHTATFTNLDPGTYTFMVKGTNRDGVWNDKESSLQLIILPPWYMTWYFRSILAILIFSAAYLVYRYRLAQALKLMVVRNRIASDLHDEIGSNLSSISIFSDVAKEGAEGTPVGHALSKINMYARESMEAMSDIVWMINASNDRFENVINRMRELAVELMEAKRFLLQLEIGEEVNNIKLGMQERKNFWLIYKEALNNAVKYSNAQKVFISLQSSNAVIKLTVKDDGDGFDIQKITPGNGIKNMQARTTLLKGHLNIISAPGEGTTVELKFRT